MILLVCEWSLKFKYWRLKKEAKVSMLFHFLIVCNCLLIILNCGGTSWEGTKEVLYSILLDFSGELIFRS